jgi:hypothetical protein
MPETKYILILANSVRSQKHCVAGKVATPQADGNYDIGMEWIRLTDSRVPDGAVPYANTICPGKGSVRPLQLIKVELQDSCNDANHPEDWNFEPTLQWTWESSTTFASLPIVADNPPKIWHDGSASNSVLAGYVPKMPAPAATLYLIKAPDGWSFTFWKEWNSFENRNDVKRKLTFSYAGEYHEFSVTDKAFTSRHNIYNRATETRQTLTVPDPNNVYFCLSLTRLTPPDVNLRFSLHHYKICATIFEP